MSTIENIKITQEDRKAALAILSKSSMISNEEAISNYKEQLDQFCKDFGASSYQELLSCADAGKFSPEICSTILDYCSYLEREINQ